MTQRSWPWSTVAGLGDGASELSEAISREFLALYFGVQDPTSEGVSKGVLNELEVTGASTPLSVNTGSAICYGLYSNDAAVNLAVSTPAVGTTGGRVVLQTNWAGTGGAPLEARTRLAVIMNTDGNPAIPALTQAFGTTWEISLATFTITTGEVITLTDDRTFRRSTAMVDTDELIDEAVTAAKIANRTRVLIVPAINITGNQGTNYVILVDGVSDSVNGIFRVPSDYVSGMTIKAVLQATASGNIYSTNVAYYAADGESYNASNVTVGPAAVALTIDDIDEIQSLNMAGVALGDYINLYFSRYGGDGNDTINANVLFFGWVVEYTADS